MSWVDAAAAALDAFGLARLRGPRGPAIVMYHGIGGEDGVDPGAFAEHLSLLSSLRRVVPLEEAVSLLGRPEASEVAAITFDDGYRDFATLALPRLAERGLHATLFVPAGHVGGSNAWDRGAAPERPLLDEHELRKLDPGQVTVGAHGLTHCRLAGLEPQRLREETQTARRVLEDVCGRPVTLFAYPYGQGDDFDAAAERVVEEAGYLAACSTRFGRGSTHRERYRLRRIGIGPADTTETLRRKLEGAYDLVAAKESLGLRVRRAVAALSGRGRAPASRTQ